MKKCIIITTLLFSVYFSQAQIVNIPDANFKNALISQGVDTNNDGEIQVSEAEALINLGVTGYNISSLEGIQSFTNLEVLHCQDNQLSHLDLSQNSNLKIISCERNQLTSFDLSQNPNLEELLCSENYLTSINISQNPNLIWLKCGENQLTSLDVTQNPNLQNLYCSYNQLTSLDVTQNPNLEYFYCGENQLTSLNVSQNLNLKWFNCGINQLTSLDVTQNQSLQRLWCFENQLTSLDVTQNPILFRFACGDNQLTSLDLTQNPNLYDLSCYVNELTSLDISQNPNLVYFYGVENQLTSLNIKNGNNHNLIRMWAYDNPNLNCITVDDIDYANNQNCNDNDWCKDDWTGYNEDISEDCILDITELVYTEIQFYPNPVKDIINITSEIPFDILNIYNLQGQLINETKNNQIDVSQLNKGLYFVSIIIDGKNIVKKFIKE